MGKHAVSFDRGASMVELALTFTLLVTLLVGTVTAAIAFSNNNSIENAAREASRYGATLPGPIDSSWFHEVRAVARAAAQGDLDPSVDGQYICVAHIDGAGGQLFIDADSAALPSNGRCFSDGRPPSEARIQVVTRRASQIQAVFFSMDLTLEAPAAARYERSP
jgi:hypothetical protein